MSRKVYTAQNLTILHSKYAKQHYQGTSRWVVVVPETKQMFGARGKDEVPEVIKLMIQASTDEGIEYSERYQSLIEYGVLVERPPNVQAPLSYLPRYHAFVRDYPFNNYGDPARWHKDRAHMAEYGKVRQPPPVYTDWSSRRHGSIPLPQPHFKGNSRGGLEAVATLLAGCFRATGSIDGGDFGPWLRKASPSGGDRHPTECIVELRSVEDFEDGVYIYDADWHSLVLLRELANHEAGGPSIYLSFVSRVERPMWRYREARALRPAIIDGGHVIGNARLFACLMGYELMPVRDRLLDLLREDRRYMHLESYAFTESSDLHTSVEAHLASDAKADEIQVNTEHSQQYKTNPFT